MTPHFVILAKWKVDFGFCDLAGNIESSVGIEFIDLLFGKLPFEWFQMRRIPLSVTYLSL